MCIRRISYFLTYPLQLIKCFIEILNTPKYLTILIIPYLIGIITFIISSYFFFSYRDDLIELFIKNDSWLFSVLSWLLIPILIILSSLLSVLTVIFLAETFIEFFLEKVCIAYKLDIPEVEFKRLARYLIKSLSNDLKRLIFITFLSIITLCCTFIPILIFIPPIMLAFMTGFDLINLPLSMFDVSFKERKKILKTHFLEVIALGSTLLLFLIIPLGGVLFLPPAYLLAFKKLISWGGLKKLNFSNKI